MPTNTPVVDTALAWFIANCKLVDLTLPDEFAAKLVDDTIYYTLEVLRTGDVVMFTDKLAEFYFE